MNKLQKSRIIAVILLVIWAAVIFVMSAQPAKESSRLSGGIVTKVISVVCYDFKDLSAERQTSITDTVTFIVRKTAHFLEYFILGLLAFVTANTFRKYKFFVRTLSAAAFCVLYAVSDEIHQYFVPGRACRFGDICIDTAGSILAIVLLASIVTIKKKRKSGEFNA